MTVTNSLADAVLFVAAFRTNVQMALTWRDKPPSYPHRAWGRLPLQVPLIAWALHVSRDYPDRS